MIEIFPKQSIIFEFSHNKYEAYLTLKNNSNRTYKEMFLKLNRFNLIRLF